MSKSTKVLIVIGCGISGILNGLIIVNPNLAAVLSGVNAGIAMIIAAVTGVSIVRGEE